MSRTSGEKLRARLDHPVIDADGHTVEFLPALLPYFQKAGIADDVERFLAAVLDPGTGLWGALSPEERERNRTVRPSWWAVPARNTLDFATVSMPALLHERLPQLGIDFAVVYPSLGLVLPHVADDVIRTRSCRALNQFHADVFQGTEQRLAPVAVVPMHTPDEAIEELDYAVTQLGFKAVMIASYVTRPIMAVEDRGSEVARHATWIDSFGIDSPYDYDPFWSRCIELGISPAAHSGAMGWDGRRSISSYMANHIGHFATASEALCRSLFFGGVTRRFPALRIAFLEGGASWGCSLLADLVGHWEKRNPEAIRNYDPALFDRPLFDALFERHGGALRGMLAGPDIHELGFGTPGGSGEPDDEFEACGVEEARDVARRFVPNFHFGCEADDPLVHHAFERDALPFGVSLRTLFGSDIGHWDVPDMEHVLEESFELRDRGRLDAEQFRAFTFTNAARFYTDTNPDFFSGTEVASAVRAETSSRENRRDG